MVPGRELKNYDTDTGPLTFDQNQRRKLVLAASCDGFHGFLTGVIYKKKNQILLKLSFILHTRYRWAIATNVTPDLSKEIEKLYQKLFRNRKRDCA